MDIELSYPYSMYDTVKYQIFRAILKKLPPSLLKLFLF